MVFAFAGDSTITSLPLRCAALSGVDFFFFDPELAFFFFFALRALAEMAGFGRESCASV